jgi:hypothetical protein
MDMGISLAENLLTVNVPLILKVRQIFFFFAGITFYGAFLRDFSIGPILS